MLVIVVIIFTFSWLPLYAIFIHIKLGDRANFEEAEETLEDKIVAIATPIAQWLGASNSCINPILYAFFNKKYRQGFAAIIRSRTCCGTIRPDEQHYISQASVADRSRMHRGGNRATVVSRADLSNGRGHQSTIL